MSMFPDNLTSSYKVNLPKSLELDPENGEVGLSEIQLPHSWYNMRRGRNKFIKELHDPSLEEIKTLFQINKDANGRGMKYCPSGKTPTY